MNVERIARIFRLLTGVSAKQDVDSGRKNFTGDSVRPAADSYLPPSGNIRYPVVNFRGRLTRSTSYAKRLCDVRFKDTPELSPQRAFGIAQGLLRAYQRAPQRHPARPYPHGLFSFRAAQFSAFTLWLSFYAVFPYEKRSAVSFPPDVAPSKDTGEHWTLLHEIYSYIYVRSASTFFEQLSIFDCDPLSRLW